MDSWAATSSPQEDGCDRASGPLLSPCTKPTCLSQGAVPTPSSSHRAWPEWAPGSWEGSLQGQEEKRAFNSENRFLSKFQAWELGWNRERTSFLALHRPKRAVSAAQSLYNQPLPATSTHRVERLKASSANQGLTSCGKQLQ